MATSETRMGSTWPTNGKGIKRKVVVRSWIENERDREREGEKDKDKEYIYIDAVDGVWEICDARKQ